MHLLVEARCRLYINMYDLYLLVCFLRHPLHLACSVVSTSETNCMERLVSRMT